MKKLSVAKTILICVSVALVLFSCNENDKLDIERSAAAFDIRQGEASVKRSNQNFMKAFKARDSLAVSNCYTTNAKLMITHKPAIEGRDDIKHFISQAMNNGVRDFDLHTVEIWGDSTLLTEEGTYKFSDSTGTQLDKGNYIVLWKTEAGNWKMFREIRTSELPAETTLPKKKITTKKSVFSF